MRKLCIAAFLCAIITMMPRCGSKSHRQADEPNEPATETVPKPVATETVEKYGHVIDSIDSVCEQMPDSTTPLRKKKMERMMSLYSTVAYPHPRICICAHTDEEARVAKAFARHIDNHIEKTNMYFSGDYDWEYLEDFCTKRYIKMMYEYWDLGLGLGDDPIMGINDIGARHLISVKTVELKGRKGIVMFQFGDLKREDIVVHNRKMSVVKEGGKWLIDEFLLVEE